MLYIFCVTLMMFLSGCIIAQLFSTLKLLKFLTSIVTNMHNMKYAALMKDRLIDEELVKQIKEI